MTVTARVSSGSSRYAMPSLPELVYAALLYTDDNKNENFAQAETADGGKLKFSFQRPKETSDLILEIFAFIKADVVTEDDTTNFSRSRALFSGNKTGLRINGDAIEVNEAIALTASSDNPGAVSLKIKVPADCSLEINDTTHFTVTGTSPNYTLTQAGDGISAGAYSVTFTVKKGDKIIHIFSEYINVINGLCTDTWSGLAKDAAKDIANSISKTVYVRGTDGWYDGSDYNATATASDDNSGSFLSPFKTIQKAVDTIIARNIADLESNDGEPVEPYTIYVDGTLTATSSAALAYFNDISQALSLKIVSLSASKKAVLNGNGTVRCVSVGPLKKTNLNLTFENLVITGGNSTGNGGGIFFAGKTLEMTGCEVVGCEANHGGGVYVNGGKFKMTGGTISGSSASIYGGGVFVISGGTFEMSGTAKITGCKTTSTSNNSGGGGIYNAGTLTITGGTISGCTAINGGGIYNNVSDASITSTITNCEISGCKATGSSYNNGYGGGIYNASGALELTDVTIIGENDNDNTDARYGGGIFNSGSLTVTGGEISKCTVSSGGGIHNNAGTLKMTGVTISNCTANYNGGGIVVSGEAGASVITNCKIESCTANNTVSGDAGGGGIYCYRQTLTLTGGTISDCESAGQGGGISIQSGKSPLTIDGVTITNCNANIGGGGSIFTVATEGINQEIKNCIIKLCEATSRGGGIHIYGGSIGGKYSSVNVRDTEISECASPSGSGVFLSTGTSLFLKDSTVKNDVGTSTGVPSIYLAGSTTITEGVIDFSTFTATYKAKVYVQDALGQNPVATIKLGSAYQIGDTILQAAEGYTLTETDCQRFTIDGGTYGIALVDGEGKLVIGGVYLDSSSGSDANSGLTASNAVKTLSKAIELFDSQYAQKIIVCETYTLPSEEINLLDRMGGG